MPLTKVQSTGITDSAVTTAKVNADAVTEAKIADDAISEEHLDKTSVTGHTAITSLADTDKFLVSDASDSGNLKYVENQYLGGFDVSSITGATEMAEVPAGTDEFVLSDGGTLKRLDFAHMNNTPAFIVRISSDQTISNGADRKIIFDAEDVDTDSAFASNKFTVPSGKGGVYHMIAGTRFPYLDDREKCILRFYINGSEAGRGQQIQFYSNPDNTENARFTTSATFLLTENDYVEVYFEHNEGSSQVIDGGSTQMNAMTFFAGYRVSGAVAGST